MSPSPVTARHRKSLNHSGILERLSNVLIQCLSAVICACSRSLGIDISVTLEGSPKLLIFRLLFDLPVPCSPFWLGMTWGISGIKNVAIVTIKRHWSSFWILQNFKTLRGSPPLTGMTWLAWCWYRLNMGGR